MQKILYLGIILVGIMIVISGLALWKPVQFSELASLFDDFQTIRLVHFICMSAIVAFLLVHVALALLVPQSLVAMLTGGPVVPDDDTTAHRRSNLITVKNMLRSPTPSIFRPKKPVDQSVLTENRALLDDINRRSVLRGAISLGALTMLTGCGVSETNRYKKVLRAVSSWNDRVQEGDLPPRSFGADLRPAQVVKPPRFNAHYGVEDVMPVDGATWKLELAGLINDKRPWTAIKSTSYRSRRSSSATSAWKAGIISANGPARTWKDFYSTSAPI